MSNAYPDISVLDHLLDHLQGICFQPLQDHVPLRWITADPSRREEMVASSGADWAPMTTETIWGPPQSYFWIKGEVVVPKIAEGQRLYIHVDAAFGRVMGRSDPQCLVRVNGAIRQGVDYNHRRVLLTTDAQPGEVFDVLIEAGTIEDRRQIGFAVHMQLHTPLAEEVYFDLKVPLDVARHLPETDHRRDQILRRVHQALRVLDLRPGNPKRQHDSLLQAREIAAKIYVLPDATGPHVTVTGHTHIDVAWLWRVRETRQKMARSMATALTLMEEFPDYRFMYNQGFLLEALAQDYPDLFSRIKEQHAAGKFEVEGALWLEPDANMTGGESLVRHILRGVRYHQKTFGVRPRIVWLPDTFGYSAALPQIMALAGLEVFVTHKMSWNDTNKMPAEVFHWQGIDGTKVLTYFLTTQPANSDSIGTTYCPDLTASHVLGAWRRFSQKGAHDDLFLVYGHGDGGGGPTREMLEQIRRMERGIPGLPRVSHGHMGPFFDQLLEQVQKAPDRYPTWVGELYAEFHRGTFTSVAEIKHFNRKAEAELRGLEALACFAMVRADHPYPAQEIAALWDILLLAQFHDILPGTSIGEVYEDSRADAARFSEGATALSVKLGQVLGPVAMNPLGAEWTGLLPAEAGQDVIRPDGSTQTLERVKIPALGALPAAAPPVGVLTVGPDHLENAHLAVRFDEKGRMASVMDKATGREILTGPGNRLLAFRDLPRDYEAWDIDASYADQVWEVDDLIDFQVVETGPLRAALRFEWRYEASRIVQIVSLGADDRLVEIDTWADWRDPHTLLKAAFPLSVRTDQVRSEIQFGHVTRPTYANTSWDQARFEAPHHRFVALEEPGIGVAILNDCKYGYDAQGQTLRLSLLRAPTWPWNGADIGEHRFRYGLAVYDRPADLPPLAEAFNHPMQPIQGPDRDLDLSPLLTVPDGVVVESLKRAEDSDAMILRLREANGARLAACITTAPEITSTTLCDLLEENDAPLNLSAPLDFAPFEIKTLKLHWTTL